MTTFPYNSFPQAFYQTLLKNLAKAHTLDAHYLEARRKRNQIITVEELRRFDLRTFLLGDIPRALGDVKRLHPNNFRGTYSEKLLTMANLLRFKQVERPFKRKPL